VIVGFFSGLGAWNWVVLGLVLLILEILVPGTFLVWFGIAAILTGILALLIDLAWQAEALIFAVLALVLVLVGRRVYGRSTVSKDQPFLNDRGMGLVGGFYVLAEPIVDGKGRIRINDSNWRITGPDLPSGTRVRVTGADGAVLEVARAEG
jgi:membrane protein implicated in regulation of membrane protease activity